jgi:hypothetical protein
MKLPTVQPWAHGVRAPIHPTRTDNYNPNPGYEVAHGATLGIRGAGVVTAYRVLLTRARQGMVICVPPGSLTDHTRQPAFYDGTYDYL